MSDRQVVVVGGGIAGLAAAHALLERADPPAVVVIEAAGRLGGKISTTPFAGAPAVDEGADAFLARVPWATGLATDLGLRGDLVSPSTGSAAIWFGGLHPIPDGLVLGMPTDLPRLARTRLLSARGKARAALEPFLPRTSTAADSVGGYVRARFGDEVHERLVDPLIGGIYAADTDHFSLAAVPQLAQLASGPRSVLLGSRRRAPAKPDGPVFYAPRGGMEQLVTAAADRITGLGGRVVLGTATTRLEPSGTGWRVSGETGELAADAVVLACPAIDAAQLLGTTAPQAATRLGEIDYADVAIVTVAVDRGALPPRVASLSGYLVPKPVQRHVTAVSFGSHKWPHWSGAGTEVLRISLGRAGAPVLHLADDELTTAAIREAGEHLGLSLEPTAVRVTRWARAFPQYRPGHARRVGAIEAALPPGIALAGASYHGIGIPACIRSGQTAAAAVATSLGL